MQNILDILKNKGEDMKFVKYVSKSLKVLG